MKFVWNFFRYVGPDTDYVSQVMENMSKRFSAGDAMDVINRGPDHPLREDVGIRCNYAADLPDSDIREIKEIIQKTLSSMFTGSAFERLWSDGEFKILFEHVPGMDPATYRAGPADRRVTA